MCMCMCRKHCTKKFFICCKSIYINHRNSCLYLGVQLVPACLLCLAVLPYLEVQCAPVVQAHLGALLDQVALIGGI